MSIQLLLQSSVLLSEGERVADYERTDDGTISSLHIQHDDDNEQLDMTMKSDGNAAVQFGVTLEWYDVRQLRDFLDLLLQWKEQGVLKQLAER